MFRKTTVIWLLLLYILCQLAALFLNSVFFLLFYVIAYIIAIIHSAIKSSKAMARDNNIKSAAYSLTCFFIANLILILIYLPTLVYDPEINWSIKGEVDQDPMILQAYVPVAFFIIATIIITLTILVTKIVLLYKTRRTRLTE